MEKKDIKILVSLLKRQLNIFWVTKDRDAFDIFTKLAYEKVIQTLVASNNKYYKANGFSPYNSVHYSIFLYFFSNIAGSSEMGGSKEENQELASKVYYLNKIMNGVEWFWAIDLPEHFMAEHPIGSVLGRAKYGDYLFVYQNTTVGGNHRGSNIFYPEFGNHIIMYANSSVLGKCTIGNYVIISANTHLINETVPDYSIVFGSSPNITIKSILPEEMKERFIPIWG